MYDFKAEKKPNLEDCMKICSLGVWLKARTGAHAEVSDNSKLLYSLQSAKVARISGMEDTKV